MRKSSLFADKNRVGKGDWERRTDKKKIQEAFDRMFGDKDPIKFQSGKRTKEVYK